MIAKYPSYYLKPRIILIPVFIAFIIFAYGQPQIKYLSRLENKTQFEHLCGDPLSSKYGNVKAIKVVYDIVNDDIYFLNSRNYKYHHGFCSKKLGYNKGLEHFNKHNYSFDSEARTYLLGNLNYYESLDKYIMDLSPADLMEVKNIEFLHQKIVKSVFVKENILLLLNTSRLMALQDSLTIPIILPESIYKHQTYQAIGISQCLGYLRFVTKDSLKKKKYNENDILVLNETPNNIPITAGIISSSFQTPLSHLSILGRNRSIPIMAYKGAYEDKKFRQLEGEYVLLEVKKNGYRIERSNPDQKKRNSPTKKKKISLHQDFSIDTLVDLSSIDEVHSSSIGSKAKNFAILNHLSKSNDFKVPEGSFAIPFYFYHQHMVNSGALTLLEQLLMDIQSNKDSVDINKRLKSIRKHIINFPMDETLLEEIYLTSKKLGGFQRLRFRSSTNAEDRKGFGGAGLYKSKTGIIGDHVKPVDMAIKKVWASLWSLPAFEERELYNLNQQKVSIGVLVHRSFPNEMANGVAITKNIYRESNLGFVINVQLGDESVVKPKKGVICDQVICYESQANKIYTDKDIVEVITKSSLNNGELIMTNDEIIHLAKQLEIIKKHFYERDKSRNQIGFNNYGLDVEFKLDQKERNLYVKQVRYYND